MKKIILCLLCITYLASCKKEYSEQFVTYTNNPLNDTSWRPTVIAHSDAATQLIPILTSAPMLDSFDVVTGGTINFPDNLQLTFPPHACTASNGAVLTNKVKIEVTYLRKKGDFIRFAKPTTSYNSLLQTGGSFNVRVTQNGNPVVLGPGISYKIKYRNTAPSNDMKFFYEDKWIANNDTTATWVLDNQLVLGNVTVWQQYDSITQTTIKGYEITSFKLNWINCDFFNDTTQPYTRLNVTLPLNFTNINTSVYVVFKNKNIVAGLNSDMPSKTFYFPKVPIGSEVTLVTVSKIGSEYYLGHKDITATNANLISVNPELKSLADVNTYLNSL